MGKITLEDSKGHKVELIFTGEAMIKAAKDNKGTVFFGPNKGFVFIGTDQKYEEELKPSSK